MGTIKIKIGKQVHRYRRFVAYRIKPNIPKNMVEYIRDLLSFHKYTIEELATSKYVIAEYFEPYVEYEKIN